MDRAIRTLSAARAGIVVSIAIALAGCTTTAQITPPRFDGDVYEQREGTMNEIDDIGIGLGNVGEEGAGFSLTNGVDVENIRLAPGSAGEAFGLSLRLCAVYVDTNVGRNPMPGSIDSRAYFVASTEGEAPACPRRTS